jgi:hypothetical protein
MCADYPDVSPIREHIISTKSEQRLVQSPKYDYFI